LPNWCENTVRISGSEEDIKKLMELITDEFDFDKILSLPPELKGFTRPVDIITEAQFKEQEKRYEVWKNASKEEREEKKLGSWFIRGMTKKMEKRFLADYGATNWYDWCVNNWGVKWSASDVVCKAYDCDVDFSFMTPWSPPTGIYNKLVELFPNISISWLYNEPGMELAGYLPD